MYRGVYCMFTNTKDTNTGIYLKLTSYKYAFSFVLPLWGHSCQCKKQVTKKSNNTNTCYRTITIGHLKMIFFHKQTTLSN